MNDIISRFPYHKDGDLNICLENGVAYQRDMSMLIEYGPDYFENYQLRAGTEIAKKLNAGRVAFVEKYFKGELLDIGIGCGEFIESRPNTFGYDINPVAIDWLMKKGLYRDNFSEFYAFSFWDVLEHVPDPSQFFRNMGRGTWVFISIPVFDDLTRIRESKHYKPGEHLYYFTVTGFLHWMQKYAFDFAGMSGFEMEAGRQSIQTFAFRMKYPE